MTGSATFRPSTTSDTFRRCQAYVERAQSHYVENALVRAKPATREAAEELRDDLNFLFTTMLFNLVASVETGSGVSPATIRNARAFHAAAKSGVTDKAEMPEDIAANTRQPGDKPPSHAEMRERLQRGLTNIFAVRPDNKPRHTVMRHLKLLSEGKHNAFSGFDASLLPNLMNI